MIVDHGYLEATNLFPGVLIRTTKVVAIDGMDPVASAFWSCILGWSDIGQEMLLGCAATLPDDAAAGDAWVARPAAPSEGGPAHRLPPRHHPRPRRNRHPVPTIGLPEGTGQQIVTKTVNLWIDCIDEVSGQTAALATKASKGQATAADIAAYSASVGARIASDPWRFVEALTAERPTRPTRPPRPNTGRQS